MRDSIYVSPPAALPAIEAATARLGFPMASEPLTGALLRALAASKPHGRFLEVGTGTGIATAWLLDGMDAGSTLISVDIDPDLQQVARDCLGNDPRLTLTAMDGLAFLRSQPRHSFDLVFADAMPGKYDGLDLALAVVKPGGIFVIDDMLPQSNWPADHAAKVPPLIRALTANPHFTAVPLAWATGIVIAVRRPPLPPVIL